MKLNTTLQSNKKVLTTLILLSFLLYGNSIRNGFSLDDSYITVTNYPKPGEKFKPNNLLVSKGFSGIPEIWKSRYAHDGESSFDYRPIVTTTFAIEYAIFGQNPHINHIINIILYALVCFLVFLFTKKILAKINIENSHLFSFICALIFLFHPSHSEVVNNIKCRDELIASGMGFLAALFFVKHNENKNIKYLLIGCLFIITGLLAKMTTILFLFIIPLSLLFFYNSKIKKVILMSIIIFICFQVFNLVRDLSVTEMEIRHYYRFENPLFTDDIDFFTKIFFTITTFGFYIKMMIFPYPLCYYYGSNMLNPNEPISQYFIFAIIFTISVVYFIYKKKNMLFIFGILCFSLTLAPFLNLHTPVAGIVGERLSFIASYGFIFSITSILYYNTSNFNKIKSSYKYSFYVFCFICFIYGFNRNKAWESKLSLFENDAKRTEKSAKANSLLGNEYFEGLFMNKMNLPPNVLAEKCMKHYNLAIQADSSIFSCYNNLGALYYSFYGDYNSAFKYFSLAILQKPFYPQAYENLGNSYKKLNQIDLSYKAYIKSIQQNPKQYSAYLEIIKLFFELKKYKIAIKLSDISLSQFPNDYEIIVQKANCYMMMENHAECLIYFEKAYNINPTKRLAGFISDKYKLLGNLQKHLEYMDYFNSLPN
jgi:tetratricopeptide (TPR) repeat protein